MVDTNVAEWLSALGPGQIALVIAFLWWRLDSLEKRLSGLSEAIDKIDQRLDISESILNALAPLARRYDEYYSPPARPMPRRNPRPRRKRKPKPVKPANRP